MGRSIQQRLDEKIEVLQYNAPLKLPVTVKRLNMPKHKDGPYAGDWTFENGEHVIRIDKRLDWRSTRDTLIHEWAHAMDHEFGESTSFSHGPSWGEHYARLYRIIHNCK